MLLNFLSSFPLFHSEGLLYSHEELKKKYDVPGFQQENYLMLLWYATKTVSFSNYSITFESVYIFDLK